MKRLRMACLVVLWGGLITTDPGIAQAQTQPPAQARNSFVGTWLLVPEKSTFSVMPYVRSVWKIEPVGDRLRTSVETELADGQVLRYEFIAAPDGKDYPLKGLPTADVVVMRRVDARTLERTHRQGERIDTVYVSNLSADSKVMTVTQKGTNRRGQAVNNTLVFARQ